MARRYSSRKTGPAYKVDVAEFTLFTRLTESGQLRTGPTFSCRRFELYTKSATRTFLMHAGPRRWGSKNNAIISAVAAMPPKRAFVIMPFSPTLSEKDWAEVFENVFKPALEECGYECSRAETSRGSLIASILEGLVEADLVLADVTDRNANVFYELGVRHSLRRGTIIVSNGTEHVPSDLRGYWFLTYGLRPAEVIKFKAEIKRLVREFEDKPQRSDSPVSDYLDRVQLSTSRQINHDNVKKLGALLTELSGNELAIRQYLSTEEPQLYSLGCLQLLLQTRYVDVGPELLKATYELDYKLELLKSDRQGRETATAALEEIEIVAQGISGIRQRIVKGDFAEPAEASMMLWSPRESQDRPSQHLHPADELSESEQQARDEGAYYSSVDPPPEHDYSMIVDVPAYFCASCGSPNSSGTSACPLCGKALGSKP